MANIPGMYLRLRRGRFSPCFVTQGGLLNCAAFWDAEVVTLLGVTTLEKIV